MDKLRAYLQEIQEVEDLHGKIDDEKTREVLLKYFRNYDFADREEAIKFFIAWDILEHPLINPNPVLEYCAKNLGRRYGVKAIMKGLKIIISPKDKNVYSFNPTSGEWHEGYDPFEGDINSCFGDTMEEAIKSLYVKDTSHDWPIHKPIKMGLITESCGYGKTHWVEHELIDEINEAAFVWNELKEFRHYERKDILFITTRRSILDQQVKYGEVVNALDEDFSTSELNWNEERPNKVRIITTSRLGRLYKENKIEKMFPIVVVDELHSLFLDTMFAEDSYSAIECIFNEFAEDTIKIGLTATPEFLLDYIDEDDNLFYLLDEINLPPKYNADEVLYYNHTYLAKTLQTLTPTEDDKVIVYCPSAKSAIAFAENHDNSAYLISKYSKYTEAVEKQQELYDYIIENQKLPDGINMIFMTSAYREGMELKDPAVKTVVIDASDEITIWQFIGRIRNNIKKVIINTNKNQEDRINKNAEIWNSLIGKTYEDLAEQYGRQLARIERKENTTLLVQKRHGKYELNKFFIPVHAYLLDCYTQANNKVGNMIVRRGKRKLSAKEHYFKNSLRGYSKTPIRNADIAVESANWGVVEEYLGKRLVKADKDELCEKIDWRNKENRLIKWTKVKQELTKRNYKIQDKKSGSTRYTIIEK